MAVTVAILGGGFMGVSHANNYAALGERVRVKTVCSRSAERAQRVADIVGAEVSTDLEAVISDPEVDAVDICLPTPLHRTAAERAFGDKKAVFLEKPLALTVEDGEAIVRAAERGGRTFMVGLVLRFWPEYVELHRRVTSGELGRPLSLAASRLSPPADWAEWFADPSQSGGAPVDLMVHDFDQANWLLGEPRTVYARGGTSAGAGFPDHVVAVVDYDGAAGGRGGEHVHAGELPLLEPDPGQRGGRRGRVRVPGRARGGRRQHRRGRSVRARAADLPARRRAGRDPHGSRSIRGARRSRSSCRASRTAASRRTAPARRRSWRCACRWPPIARSRAARRRPCSGRVSTSGSSAGSTPCTTRPSR